MRIELSELRERKYSTKIHTYIARSGTSWRGSVGNLDFKATSSLDLVWYQRTQGLDIVLPTLDL